MLFLNIVNIVINSPYQSHNSKFLLSQKNPDNCEMIFLGHDGAGKLKLDGRCDLVSEEKIEDTGGTRKFLRYKFHKTLHIVPEECFKKRVIRMSPNEEGYDTNRNE